MSEIRNPFAKRNGRIITINDLSQDENGLKCNCECPACGGIFVARMGEVRVWHFAHSGEPCEAKKQFINSIYQFVAQALEDKGYFYFPGMYVWGDLTQTNVSYEVSSLPKNSYDKILDAGKIAVHSVKILNNVAGISTFIILNEDRLAIRLSINVESCVEKHLTQYEEMATICISIDDAIYRDNEELLSKEIIEEVQNKEWIYSPELKCWLDALEKKHIEAKEKERREAEERRIAQSRRKEEIRKKREAIEAKKSTLKNFDYTKYIPQKKRYDYKPSMRRCSICKQSLYYDDVQWGVKTQRYYCQSCIERKGLHWKEL